MTIDLETSLHFIKTRFEGFTNVIRKSDEKNENGVYDFTHRDYPFNGWDKICQWSHHDLSDSTVVESLKRRAKRLVDCIDSPTTLLLYYDKVNRPVEYYRAIVDPFTQSYLSKIVVICPSTTPADIVYYSESLCIVSGNTGISRVLHYIYTFNILPRPTSRPIHPDTALTPQ
jgi:hypothetical protein